MDNLTLIPKKARALTALGDLTATVLLKNFAPEQGSLFPHEEGSDFTSLAMSFKNHGWTDAETAQLMAEYFVELKKDHKIDLDQLERWIIAHPNDSAAVLDCLRIIPPNEIDIIKVLSRKGSQKLVFLANWRLRLQEVVLKKIFGDINEVEKILGRELTGHPLNLVHPNIIETFSLTNPIGDKFLVERKLPEVLSDEWEHGGVNEVINVLYNISSALKFLHENSLVHGDVKPDNIGKKAQQYVLLDLGICRNKSAFTREATPTGSIRTRAPELLIEEQYIEPEKVDVWALGATIYNFLANRYPLIDREEKIPRIFEKDREPFEREVANRAKKLWNKIDMSHIPENVRSILLQMLEFDPVKRITSTEVVVKAKEQFAAFLRIPDTSFDSQGQFSPFQELDQINKYLTKPGIIQLIPKNRKQQIISRLNELRSITGFDEEHRNKIEKLVAIIF
jgi:serine/threonine protein kinase